MPSDVLFHEYRLKCTDRLVIIGREIADIPTKYEYFSYVSGAPKNKSEYLVQIQIPYYLRGEST